MIDFTLNKDEEKIFTATCGALGDGLIKAYEDPDLLKRFLESKGYKVPEKEVQENQTLESVYLLDQLKEDYSKIWKMPLYITWSLGATLLQDHDLFNNEDEPNKPMLKAYESLLQKVYEVHHIIRSKTMN
jgi:hypothetical protein